MSIKDSIAALPTFLLFLVVFTNTRTVAGAPHVINFRSPNLYPESLSWDQSNQHFVVGSHRSRTLVSVSNAAVVDTLVHDTSLPVNASILGVFVDNKRRRLLAVFHSVPPLPLFNALVAYDLNSPDRRRIFLAPLTDPDPTSEVRPFANGVTVDSSSGNAYVTNAGGNFIWKVTPDGDSSVFSRSPVFSSHPVDLGKYYSTCGLNGLAYVSKGYLLVVQSNTGKMFRVSTDDGSATTVLLNKEMISADGVVVRKDGVVVVNSQEKAYFIRSKDDWLKGDVFDETTLEVGRFATGVALGEEKRVYVLYGHLLEGLTGNGGREVFSIVEIESEKENKEDTVWIYVLVGLGFAYFCVWRYQMRQLGSNMNKKTG